MKREYDFFFFPSNSSFLFIEACPQMPYEHWNGWSLQTDTVFPLPTCYISCYLFWVTTWYIPWKTNTCTPPGSRACRASAPCIWQDIGNCRRNSVWLLDSVLSLYRVSGWMNETSAWSPHTSCWDCSRNFRAFSVSSQKRKPTEKPSPWNTKYFLEVYSTERLILKRLYMLSLKQVGLIFSLTNSKIYVPQSVVFTLVLLTVVRIRSTRCLFCACPLDRQTIPKGHLRLFFKTMGAPLQLPVDCSVHYFTMKMFSPSAIIRESQETPILFRAAYPLLKRSKMIKKSHLKFPFKVV